MSDTVSEHDFRTATDAVPDNVSDSSAQRTPDNVATTVSDSTGDAADTSGNQPQTADDDVADAVSEGDRGESDDSAIADESLAGRTPSPAASEGGALLIREGDIAADYLERLLDIVDYDGDIDLDVENDRAIVAIIGNDLRSLVGTRGETLDALQELTRLAVAQKTGSRSRLMLDVSGHRQARRAELSALAEDTATRVRESGSAARLAAMNPFERKVVHDAIAALAGVHSESEGEEPNRRVVVLPGG